MRVDARLLQQLRPIHAVGAAVQAVNLAWAGAVVAPVLSVVAAAQRPVPPALVVPAAVALAVVVEDAWEAEEDPVAAGDQSNM